MSILAKIREEYRSFMFHFMREIGAEEIAWHGVLFMELLGVFPCAQGLVANYLRESIMCRSHMGFIKQIS